ncbi:MAG: DUF4105 domain-containing protein [Bacteroidaceae bacterium]|nr:DUF4105 domain-containing protein [Bacteroidaceae bacterium]
MKFLFHIVLLMLLPACAYAQVDSLEQARLDSLAITEADNFVTASILVATPSDVLYSCVGHASIRMQCPHYGLDMVYTYESESVTNRVLTFFMGNLNMGMTAVPTERVLADYASEGRGITEYVLNIPLEKRKQLWQYLDGKVEEGMNLPYDYLNRSCALACLNAVSAAVLPDTLSFGEWDERLVKKSRRALLGDRTDDFPWDRFIIFTITGTEADKDCAITEKVVIPTDLIDVLQKTTLNGQPVLEEPNTLVSQTISIEKSGWLTPMVLACILLLLAVISCSWLQRPLSILLLALQLVLGLAVTYLVIFSALPNTSFSWLIVPLNPLPFLLWRWRRWWLLPFALICICWSIAMLVRIWNPLVDNAYIVFALALAINYIGQLNQLRKYSNK